MEILQKEYGVKQSRPKSALNENIWLKMEITSRFLFKKGKYLGQNRNNNRLKRELWLLICADLLYYRALRFYGNV